MFVIMSGDKKCIVKGKSQKHLCGVEEPTRKVLVSYDCERKAKAALMRMLLYKSDYAMDLYGEDMPMLEIVEADE